MTSSRSFGVVLLSFLAFPLAASTARAEPFACDITDDGARFCDGVIGCDERRDCIGEPGTEDWFCLPRSRTTPDARECMAGCTTMFGCMAFEDCPAFPMLLASCSPVEGSTIGACTYRASTATPPPNHRITYCVDGGDHIPPVNIARCHTRPLVAGDPDSPHTPNYYEGDCDMDGCANGVDNDPCNPAADSTACRVVGGGAISPFCPPPPPLACVPTSATAVTCEDARPCTSVGESCGAISVCQDDGWSDGPRCRPVCSTLIFCATAASGAAVPEQCPPFDGSPGACIPSPVRPVTLDARYDGVCVYGAFSDSSCSPSDLGTACYFDPETMAPTGDFFRGDCDSDGTPNGCDSMRCAPGGASGTCEDVPGDECGATLPEPDAGIDLDGGNVMLDAGPAEDAGSATEDAGSGNDAGNTTSDAGAGAVDASGGSFSGGGGCRCSAVGGDRGGLAGLSGLLVAMSIVIARRRRRLV